MNYLAKLGYSSFERVDAGGQGTVYKVLKEGQIFAVKVVALKTGNFQRMIKHLRNEVNITKKLKHPNCIEIKKLFCTQYRVYFVMDFMSNGTIGNLIRKGGPLCEWNAKEWFPAILFAVKYLHGNMIAHRDLKLDNVLLDKNFNPIVADFGISRNLNLDHSGEIIVSKTYCGTRSHQPPEILKHVPYNAFKCDTWCLGIMLFIMINQVQPFSMKATNDVIYAKQMNKDYHLQTSVEAKISAELKSLIRMLLEPKQELRPTVNQVCTHNWIPTVFREINNR